MEPPSGGDPDTLKDAKQCRVPRDEGRRSPALRARPVRGYRDIDGVAPDSTTETYAALRLEIDNWRWAGVPFFIRTGKWLPVKQTELRLVFKHPPRVHFITIGKPQPRSPARSCSRSTRAPASGWSSTPSAPTGPAPTEIQLDMEFAQEGGEGATPYEVLLHAALVGDSTHFTRQDNVEATWRVVQPLLDSPPPRVHAYAPRVLGPGGGRDGWSPTSAAGTGRGCPPVASGPLREISRPRGAAS